MLKAIWYRPAQACVIALLAALVTACAVMTPVYQRALDQASTQVELDHAARGSTLLQLTSLGILPSYYTGPGDPIPALTAGELAALILGSTSHRAIHLAECDVLVVKATR